jgi:hypothetical protein
MATVSHAQTISWSGYSAGTLSYNNAPMTVTINNSPGSYHINSSPRYHATSNSDIHPSANNCGSPGLLLEMDWGNNAHTQNYATTLVMNFASCVFGPITFSIFDVNTDNFNDWGDWIDVSGVTNTGPTAAPSASGCVPNSQVVGNVRRLRGGIASSGNTTGCTCGTTNITVGSAGQKITSVTLKYYADPAAWATNPNNPAWQYIIISNITVGSISCVLPVELVTFTGSASGNNKTFNWSTASELNNDHFQLEHSTDGEEFFPVGDEIKGKGTTSTINYYATHILNDDSFYYYRLKQVDTDVSFSYSSIILVKSNKPAGNESIKVIQSVINNNVLTISMYSDIETEVELNITDILGKTILQQKVQLHKGENPMTFDLPANENLKILRISNATWNFVKKIF